MRVTEEYRVSFSVKKLSHRNPNLRNLIPISGDAHKTLSGEERLQLAVLEDAIINFVKGYQRKGHSYLDTFREAERYIFYRRDDNRPFSFNYVCELFDINPEAARNSLRRTIEEGSRIRTYRGASKGNDLKILLNRPKTRNYSRKKK